MTLRKYIGEKISGFFSESKFRTSDYQAALYRYTGKVRFINEMTSEARAEKYWKIALGAVILIAVLSFYFFSYALKTFPFTEGWGEYYVELMKQGLMPYRDFYYYLPPVNLFFDYVLWSISGGFFAVYRILRVLERLLMLTVLYVGLCRFFNPKYVLIACIFGGIIGAGNTYDLLGDYNQTEQFLLILICLTATFFPMAKTQGKKYLILGIDGCFLGVLFMLKQSSCAAAAILYFIFLAIYCIFKRDKKFPFYILFTGCGFMVTAVPVLVWLAANGALIPFFEQVFGAVGAKGGLFTVLFSSILSAFLGGEYTGTTDFILFCAFVLLFWVVPKLRAERSNLLYAYMFLALASAYTIFWGLGSQIQLFGDIASSSGVLPVMFWAAVPAVLVLAFKKRRAIIGRPVESHTLNSLEIVVFLVFLLVSLILVLINYGQFAVSVYETLEVVNILDILFWIIYYGAFAWVAFVIAVRAVRGVWVLSLEKFVLLVGALAALYAVTMASGAGNGALRAVYVALPVLFLLLIESKPFHSHVAKSFLCLLLVIACVLSFTQKMENTYEWWGWDDEPIYTKTETVEIDALRGFKFSEKEKNLYEQSVKLIENNITDEETLWTFPYNPIFKLLTGHTELVGFVPVYFFDVCADSYATAEVALLDADLPDMIIWCDLGVDCWNTHENLFREGGRAGQRDIQRWFVDIKDEHYELVGQVENLFFYRLKDGTDPAYTYFQDPTRVNVTALPENCK